jgi:hypothetical protein
MLEKIARIKSKRLMMHLKNIFATPSLLHGFQLIEQKLKSIRKPQLLEIPTFISILSN